MAGMIRFCAFLFGAMLCLNYPNASEAADVRHFQGNDVAGQVITQTKGESGITCSSDRFKCTSGASCVDGKCTCKSGTRGHAQLACVNQNSHVTMVLADPKVMSYDGSIAHLNVPCRYLVTEIESEHNLGEKGGRCSVKVHAINHHLEEGYYLLGFDVQLSISDNANRRAKDAQMSQRVFGFGEKGVFNYKAQGKYTTNNLAAWGEPASLKYKGTWIRTEYDTENNLAILHIEQCGVMAIFKAHVKYTNQMPGLLVAVDKNRKCNFPQRNRPLSGTPFNTGVPALIAKKHELKLTKVQMTLYNAITQDTTQDFGTEAVACNVASKEFTRMCRTEAQRAFALHMCGFFYTNSTISSCLRADEFGESSGSCFGLCCISMCLADAWLCQNIKTELQIYGCGIPQHLQTLDCFQIRSTRHALYPDEEYHRPWYRNFG